MKTIDQIYGELKAAFEAESGIVLSDGGDMALRFRAFAAQVAALQAQAEFTLRQCFPQTASGDALDSHALQRGLHRTAAARAVGVLRFSLAAPASAAVTVPAGTRCITAEETEFEVTAPGSIAAGQSFCEVPARAVIAGSSGNVPHDSVVLMELAPVGVSACTNPEAFGGGCDEEDDESLRSRVLDSFCNAANSGNTAYYRNLALSVEGIAAATVQPRARGRGTVDVTIAAENGLPSALQLAHASQLMAIRREICVDADVKAPVTRTVDLELELSVSNDFDSEEVCTRAEETVRGYFTGRLLGRGFKRVELAGLIYAIPGVDNCRIVAPVSDVAADSAELPILGTLDIWEA
ncbi:MAG: baseplate J/gp47 family protein [Oscillospiraceae bacterium]|nr:baseplate J/gp47 family protein [Oscillospiraceae bacterium]